jgi:NADH-quinone oxidoreductase subunit N
MTLLLEIYLLLFSVLFLFLSLGKGGKSLFLPARIFSLGAVAVSLITLNANGLLFYGAYQVNGFSQVFKLILTVGLTFVVFMFNRDDEVDNMPEFFMFLGFSTLGLTALVSSVELISILISLEISSFSLYAIVPLRRSKTTGHLEAAIKYLFFGAVATGVMLYGMGYLYAMTHSTYLADIVSGMPAIIDKPLGILALVLTMTAFFFKLSLFPLHFWAPDIYEGASDATTTFIATVPKVAGAALLIRLTMLAGAPLAQLAMVLMVLAAFSMTVGNLAGLVQQDIKRLLGYSGIAHAGYLMLGLLAFNKSGSAVVAYYITVYLFMNLSLFYVIMLLSRNGENLKVADLAGLARRSPLLALTLAVAAFSLAGIPPTGGFTGKFFLLVTAFKAGYLPIVIIAAVNTVLSIFYYLNLVRVSYSREAKEESPLNLTFSEKILCVLFSVIILVLGIMPLPVMEMFVRVM